MLPPRGQTILSGLSDNETNQRDCLALSCERRDNGTSVTKRGARTRGHALPSTSPSTSPRCHEEPDKGNHSEPLSNSLILSKDIVGESLLGTFGGRSLGVSFRVPGESRGNRAAVSQGRLRETTRSTASRRCCCASRTPTRTAYARGSVVRTDTSCTQDRRCSTYVPHASACVGECARARERERERGGGRERERYRMRAREKGEALFSRPAFWLLRVVEGRRTGSGVKEVKRRVERDSSSVAPRRSHRANYTRSRSFARRQK